MALTKTERDILERIEKKTEESRKEVRQAFEEINKTMGKLVQSAYGPNLDHDFIAENTAAIVEIKTERKVQRRMSWGAVATGGIALVGTIIRFFSSK